MYVKLSEPLKKWTYKTLFLLDSFCRCEVLGGATQKINVFCWGRCQDTHWVYILQTSPLQNVVRAEIFGLSSPERLFSLLCLCFLTRDCSPPGSSVHEISRARILEQVAIPFLQGSSQLRDQTHVFCVSCITGGFFYWLSHQGSPFYQ